MPIDHGRAFETHDHDRCMAHALATAQAYCDEHGVKLTQLRRRVLEILLEGHRALGAYDILGRLQEEGFGSQPPVAYRALDFLVSHGFAHKIEGMNAFIACAHPGTRHNPVFLICRVCRSVLEAEPKDSLASLEAAARHVGFGPERITIEVQGLCPACAEA